MLATHFQINEAALNELCRLNGVERLTAFGSAVRGDFDPDRSDLDLLVEFRPGVHKGLFKLADMETALSALFGRRVDLVTIGSLSPTFLDRILPSSQVIYGTA